MESSSLFCKGSWKLVEGYSCSNLVWPTSLSRCWKRIRLIEIKELRSWSLIWDLEILQWTTSTRAKKGTIQRRNVEDTFICYYFFLEETLLISLRLDQWYNNVKVFLKEAINLKKILRICTSITLFDKMKYIYFKTLLNPQRFTFEEELSSKRVGKFLPPAISFSKILYNIILESVRNSRISHFHYKNPTNEINHSIRSPRKRATINFLPRPPFFFFFRESRGVGLLFEK